MRSFSTEPIYYVYIHCEADTGAPFYVGKGKGRRVRMKHGRNRFWHHVANVHGFNAHIVRQGLTEHAAYEFEQSVIRSLIGFRLCNCTEGGRGISGYQHTDRAKKAMSEKRSGKRMSEEARAAMSNTIRSRPDLLKMRSERFKSNDNPAKFEDNRRLSSQRMTDRNPMLDPANIEKMRAKKKGRPNSPEARRKISEALRGRIRGPYPEEKLVNFRKAQAPRRKVVRSTCGLEFESALAASQATGIAQGSISNNCVGRTKSAGGKVWYYVEP